MPNLLDHQPQLFGTFPQFVAGLRERHAAGLLASSSPTTPTTPDASGATLIASDQHPDHHVREGERFIASVYNAIRQNPVLWPKTALLVVYDEHGGIYDHVPPPACRPDGFVAQPAATGTRRIRSSSTAWASACPPCSSRRGSPAAPSSTGGVFEHASIPATVTDWMIGPYNDRSPREKNAETFLDLLTAPAARTDCIEFRL